jgi:hypothetical protein
MPCAPCGEPLTSVTDGRTRGSSHEPGTDATKRVPPNGNGRKRGRSRYHRRGDDGGSAGASPSSGTERTSQPRYTNRGKLARPYLRRQARRPDVGIGVNSLVLTYGGKRGACRTNGRDTFGRLSAGSARPSSGKERTSQWPRGSAALRTGGDSGHMRRQLLPTAASGALALQEALVTRHYLAAAVSDSSS